jgi:hypothetical protein
MFLDCSTIYHACMTWYDLPFIRMKKENIQREVFMLAKKSKDVNDRLRSSRARSLALYPYSGKYRTDYTLSHLVTGRVQGWIGARPH